MLIEPTDAEYVNLDPVFISNQQFTYLSIVKGGDENSATRYIYDLNDNSRKGVKVIFNGQIETLRRFSLLR
ncbi:MAG: hypothetical protein LBL49_07255 [Clostridiales Family XIII bacterium]|nr:hypothetical protein [Clostridiales Family XIII bacterium]